MFGRTNSTIVSCPDHVQLAPSEKLSGEPSQISWACYYSVARVVKLLTAVSQLRYRSVFEQGCQTLLGYMVRGSPRNSAWFARLFFLVKRVGHEITGTCRKVLTMGKTIATATEERS